MICAWGRGGGLTTADDGRRLPPTTTNTIVAVSSAHSHRSRVPANPPPPLSLQPTPHPNPRYPRFRNGPSFLKMLNAIDELQAEETAANTIQEGNESAEPSTPTTDSEAAERPKTGEVEVKANGGCACVVM